MIEDWSPVKVKDALDRGEIVLVDVRTPQEFSFERIEGALLAPMQEFQARYMPPQEEKRLVFHCGSGARSKKVAERYLEDGSTAIAHMEGGLAAWKKAGLPYIGTEMASGAPKRMDGGK